MKKINLNQLSMSWNEKQTPQRAIWYAAMLIMLLTIGVGQMWAGPTIYVVGRMQKNNGDWVEVSNTPLNCHNWEGGTGTIWPGTAMTKTAYTAAGHAVFSCELNTGNSNLIINNSWETNTWSISATEKAYPQPTCINGTWVYSIKMADALWSGNQTVSGGYIYFDNTNAQWSDAKMYLVVGHSEYIGYYELTKLAGTNLYYTNRSGLGWTDAKFVAIAGHSSAKSTGSGTPNDLTTLTHYSDVIGYGLNTGTSYMISMSSGTNCTPISIAYQTTGYTAYNSRQTVYKVLGSSTTTTDVGTVTVTTTKLTGNCAGTKDNSEATIGTSASSAYTDAVKTATVTLTASAKTGYEFVGWATSASGSVVSDDETFTYTATATTSYYAKFREKTYTVSFENDGNGTTDPNSDQTVGQLTGIAISASENDGYEFINWTITSGTGSFDDATDAETKFYPTSAATIQANFRSTATNSLTVAAGTHVTTVTGSTDPVTLGSKYAISATAFETGYEFYNWTADPAANGTFDNESNASTNVTVKNGSVTVTANAREIMRSITISGGHVYGGVATSTTAGVATSAKITANAPATGKKFTGWSLGAGVSLKAGSALTDQTIEIYSTADATVTATYADRAQVKMYFAKPTTLGWGTLYAYAWQNSNTSNNNKAYPGVEISTTETINNVVYYVYQYYTEGDGIGGAATGKSTWDRVIFGCNTDSKKTGDLTISNGHYYFKSSTGTGKAAAITSAWCIKGSWNSYSEDTDQITHSSATAGSKSISLTTGNKTFKIYNIVNETWWRFEGNVTASKSATAMNNGDGDMTLTPTIAGSYTFALGSLNGTPTLAITYPTSYRLTYAIGTVKGNEDETSITSSPSTASGSYVPSGNTVTLTAPDEKEGEYEWKGWYGAAAGTGDQLCSTKSYAITMNSNKTLYACYTEIKHDVTVEAGENGSVSTTSVNAGVATKSATITATPDAGYYFSGWTIPDGVTIATGSGTNEITINATADEKTITANFTELDKIYFRNLETMEGGAWANVYVYFGVTWNGYENAVSNSNAAYKVAMTQIGSSDVYWAYVPRSFTTSAGTAIAFSNQSVGTSTAINTGEAATRNDYNKALQMYVPSVAWVAHGAHYHNDGYWKNYPVKAATGAGYYLQTTRGTNLVEFTGQADNLDIIECTVRVDQHDQDKTFHIVSAGGKYFEPYNYSTSKYPKITSTASTMTMKGDDSDGLTVTLTSEGNYRFIIDQSSDVMELTVVYPVGVGDYRIKHSYSDSGTKYAYSDVIKAGDSHPTVSMFYNSEDATMVLQKCTLVNASGPKWDAGTAIDRDKLNKGAGVYQFDLTISADAGTIDDGAGLYDGPFYIKTDCAPGRWANFTQNVMETNTITADQFDYYYVTNAGSGSNVKFVIANQYCNAISDTIVEDATYLTISGDGTSREFMPSDGCVRFMYNSATNTASRAYMQYSSNNNFLNVKPTAESEVYLEAGGTTDLHSASDANTKIGGDDGNYVYRKTVYAVPGAVANIQATFNGSTQTFVASRTLMGGTGTEKYPITLVYDFKTNYLMAAWQPSETPITAALADVEFMYIREGQETSNQISFSGSGQFTNPKVYGVFKFDQADYKNKVGAWPRQDGQEPGYTNMMCMFYFSFPFNVKVNDIYGVGTYGTEWKIQYYDGEERAKKGFFRGDGTTTFWKDMPSDGELEAYRGYSLLLDNDYFNGTLGSIWDMNPTSVYLYFPSKESIPEVSEGDIEITVPAHKCEIDRTFEGGTQNHMNTDSHWNMVGVPLFKDHTGNFESIFKQEDLSYLYAWNPATNTLGVADAVNNFTFKAMYAYMVQYAGKITFRGSRIPSSVAARRATQEGNYKIDLSVMDNENEFLNRTYVELREEASEDFMLNEDLCMELNSRDVNIYSFAGDYDVAANVLPMSNQTVRLGLNVKKNGTYKLSMPSNFNGTATLIDTETNQRTNLGFGDYEVYLTKGNYNNRFILDVNIYKTPTAIDGVDGGSLKDGKAHKFIENGQMYILRDGRIYDATGAMVK